MKLRQKTFGVLGALLMGLSNASDAQEPAKPTISAGIDGVLAAFKSHSVVGLGDWHGLAQEEDFYAALIRDPRFAREVGNIVVEIGEASQQATIDRYINGEPVAYQDLRKVWSNPVGWIPTVIKIGLVNIYATVREVNSDLPQGQRIRVWLGDPPIDWSKVASRKDAEPILGQRDSYPAQLINNILAKGKKTLVIYGTFHYYGEKSLWGIVDQVHPGTFFRITPYTGFDEANCSAKFEKQIADWPIPTLAAPVKGTMLETAFRTEGCHTYPREPMRFAPTITPEQQAKMLEQQAKMLASLEDENSGVEGDALLYLGPAASLTISPNMPDLYLDGDYRKEIAQHNSVREFPPLSLGVHENPASPRHMRPQ
jgi:hypothetical protein